MKLFLTQKERDLVLLDILSNGGIGYLASSEVEIDYDRKHYNGVKKEGDCHEDVLVKIINTSGKLTFTDLGDEDNTKHLTYNSLKEALTNISDKHFIKLVMESLNEESDAETGYCLIQYILYGEIIYG